MIHRPQEEHADLGLVDTDLIPDKRKAPAATEALQKNNPSRKFRKEALK